MLTRRALFMAQLRGWLPATWRGWAQIVLWLAYLVAALAALVYAQPPWGLLVVNVAVMALWWRSYWTWSGRLHWRAMGTWARVGVAVAYLLLAVTPAIVLLDASHASWHARQQAIRQRPEQIWRLERELRMGGPPPTP
jgi:hypothetical protein